MQFLIQRPERQRPPSLGLGPRAARCRVAVAIRVVPPRVTASCRNLGLRERRAQAQCHEDVEDLVAQGGHQGLRGRGEELGEGEGLGGITAERVGRLGRVEIGEDGLVEAQVGPAREEAEDGEEEGGEGEEGRQAENQDQAEVDEGEAWYAQGEDSPEEGDGVGGDELAEGDEEADLKRDGAGDGGQPGMVGDAVSC